MPLLCQQTACAHLGLGSWHVTRDTRGRCDHVTPPGPASRIQSSLVSQPGMRQLQWRIRMLSIFSQTIIDFIHYQLWAFALKTTFHLHHINQHLFGTAPPTIETHPAYQFTVHKMNDLKINHNTLRFYHKHLWILWQKRNVHYAHYFYLYVIIKTLSRKWLKFREQKNWIKSSKFLFSLPIIIFK